MDPTCLLHRSVIMYIILFGKIVIVSYLGDILEQKVLGSQLPAGDTPGGRTEVGSLEGRTPELEEGTLSAVEGTEAGRHQTAGGRPQPEGDSC